MKDSIVFINSICCWNSSKLLINIAKRLKEDKIDTFIVLNGTNFCSLYESPLLLEPKHISCKTNKEKVKNFTDGCNIENICIQDYQNEEDVNYTNEWLVDNKNEKLCLIKFNDINIWHTIKGTIAKTLKLNNTDEYNDYLIKDLPIIIVKAIESAIYYCLSIPRFLIQKNITKLIIFNGYFYYESLFRTYAELFHISTIAFERSFLRNVYYFSESGIVGNRISTSLIDKENLSLIKLKDDSILEIKDFFTTKQPTVEQPIRKQVVDIDYILFIAQVPFDTVIVYDNPIFKSSLDAILFICQLSETLNHKLIIKLHPLEGKLTNYKTENLIKKHYPNIKICKDEYNIKDLILNSKFVVTINSQTGLEALILNKNVVVLGSAYYSFKGLTFDITNTGNETYDIFSKLIKNDEYPDKLQLLKLLFYLKETELYETNDDESDLLKTSYDKLKKVLTCHSRQLPFFSPTH